MIKMTVRGAAPAIIRRVYRCTDCEREFSHLHASRDEPAPDCPYCELATEPMPAAPAILTPHLHKAVGIAQQMMEEQGYTNINDYQRPGDIAAPAPAPIQTAQREAAVREMKEYAGEAAAVALNDGMQKQVANFWQPPLGAMRGEGKVPTAPQPGPDVTAMMEKAPRLSYKVEAAVTAKD